MTVPQSSYRLLLGMLFAILATRVFAQFELNASLSKPTYLAGEPVFLDLTVKNVSANQLQLETADPLTFCSGYSFTIQGARDREAKNCGSGGGSCLGGFLSLPPGKSSTSRVFLNTRYDLRQPGHYVLVVSYRASYAPAGKSLPVAALWGHQTFERHLEIVLAPAKPEELKPVFAPYLLELDSADWRVRQKASNVISLLAPPFLESKILHMLHTSDMQSVGVEGARNLGTPAAHRALSQFVKDSTPTRFPFLYRMALRYLGEIGDSSDIPILLVASRKATDNQTRRVAMEAAGEAGGNAAVPALETEMQSSSKDIRDAAEDALSFAGSRSAVPVLIQLLRSSDQSVSLFAEYGLERLTHQSGAHLDGIHSPPSETYAKWSRWWTINSQTAPVFRRDQCGAVKPLPPS